MFRQLKCQLPTPLRPEAALFIPRANPPVPVNELPVNQLLVLINTTQEFSLLKQALSQPSLNISKLQQSIQKQHLENNKQALKSNPQITLTLALEELKLKALEHAIKSMTNSDYTKVAETAFNLYRDLNKETALWRDNKVESINYQNNCKNLINKATPILQTHRGYKQVLLDILNVVFTILTLGTKKFLQTIGAFFLLKLIVKKLSMKLSRIAILMRGRIILKERNYRVISMGSYLGFLICLNQEERQWMCI
ncbi:MAG: hypothetical protein PSV35_01715 [bacterium]|nr:hypothetical protein [bacterium]